MFCPDCTTTRPAADFERPRIGNPDNDRLALAVRCNDCLCTHRARHAFTRRNCAAAKADPTGPLALAVREIRNARLLTTARVRAAVANLSDSSALVAA